MSDNALAEFLTTVLTITEAVVLVIAIFKLAGISQGAHDSEAWNDGYCSCGGKWEYEQAVGHRYDTSYIYVCSSCGKRIELYEMR